MQVLINGPEVDECGSFFGAAMKKWLPRRKKLAKTTKKPTVTTRETTMVMRRQVRLVDEPENARVREVELLPEINCVVAALNLPEQEL